MWHGTEALGTTSGGASLNGRRIWCGLRDLGGVLNLDPFTDLCVKLIACRKRLKSMRCCIRHEGSSSCVLSVVHMHVSMSQLTCNPASGYEAVKLGG